MSKTYWDWLNKPLYPRLLDQQQMQHGDVVVKRLDGQLFLIGTSYVIQPWWKVWLHRWR